MTMATDLQRSQRRFAVVGTFTTAERQARGRGLHVFAEDAAGVWQEACRLEGLENPSYLLAAPDGRCIYSVHADRAYASAFLFDAAAPALRRMSQAETGGINGVHLALHPGGRFLAVANYASGSVALLPVRADGGLDDCTQVVALPGPVGPNRTEQTMSHPHQVVFDPTGRFLLVPDKGLDRVFVLAFDAGRGKLALDEARNLWLRPGSGPRHAAFHPGGEVVWVLNELASTIVTCRWDAAAGTLTPLQWLPTLPQDFLGHSKTAAIVVTPSGDRVFASNRGHDSVACFRVDAATGLLQSAGWVPTQGACPRFMTIDPARSALLVANEQADSIVRFDLADGQEALKPGERIAQVASPATIVFSAARSGN
jgi:6-phosphogluconolactonase (cycloisomerase 2 family)